jgi:hypothetical protein
MEEFIKDITETVEGYPVKNLKWNELDNILVGMVKCPLFGRDNLHEGYVVMTWRKNGSLTSKYGGSNRKDLYLKIPTLNESISITT